MSWFLSSVSLPSVPACAPACLEQAAQKIKDWSDNQIYRVACAVAAVFLVIKWLSPLIVAAGGIVMLQRTVSQLTQRVGELQRENEKLRQQHEVDGTELAKSKAAYVERDVVTKAFLVLLAQNCCLQLERAQLQGEVRLQSEEQAALKSKPDILTGENLLLIMEKERLQKRVQFGQTFNAILSGQPNHKGVLRCQVLS